MRKGGKLESWKVERLGDVIQLEYGKPLDASKRSEDGKYPVYGANGEIARSNEYYYDKPTMIVGRKGSAGEINLTEKKFWALDVTYFVTFDDKKYDLQFLYYLLSKLELTKLAKGVKPGINRNDVYSIEVVIPPLPEQQRIVSVLDEAFASIAQAKSNDERNLVNARELFASVLQETFTGSTSEKWQTKKLEDVCSLVTDGKHGDSENESNSGYYFLSAKNIKDGTLSYDDAREITKKDFEETHRRTNLMPFDICMVNTGATIGKIALAPDDPKTFRTTFQKSVAIIKPISSIIDNAFCCYHLKSDLEKLLKVSSGSAQKNLLIGDMKNHLVRVPPLAEQRAIVGRLEALSAETGRLEEIYQSKVEALEELKKSVLAKAFEGEI